MDGGPWQAGSVPETVPETEPEGEPQGQPEDPLDSLLVTWLTLPQTADRLGLDLRQVRRLLRDRQLVAVRRAPTAAAGVEPCVPELLIADGRPLPELAGTVTVLADAGYTDADTLRWLFTPDDSIAGGSPIEALHSGHKTEVRRRAQALAF